MSKPKPKLVQIAVMPCDDTMLYALDSEGNAWRRHIVEAYTTSDNPRALHVWEPLGAPDFKAQS